MKVSSKPIASPSRTEKFPPPLMRFLRSNAGSRSRGRSRSSPLFVRKKKNQLVIETTQEPSSPKVTCTGQVRAPRSDSNSGDTTAPAKNRNCWSGRRTPKLKFASFPPAWRKLFVYFSYCKRVEIGEAKLNGGTVAGEEEDEGSELKEAADSLFFSSSPPRNALVLTRCRSAPCRSSSTLANRIWGSPLTAEETGEQQQEGREEEEEIPKPVPGPGPDFRNSTSEWIKDIENEGNSREFECSIDAGAYDRIRSTDRALRLRRCRSEPGRTGDRLNPVREAERVWFS